MRFALVGDHADGVQMACALVESAQHQLAAYTTPVAEEVLRLWGKEAIRVLDFEEILANPGIEAVIVAGGIHHRAAQLRRALQAERHVLCVHPPDPSPDAAYEASMLRDDAGCVLLPLLKAYYHPAWQRLAEFMGRRDRDASLGRFLLLEAELRSSSEILLNTNIPGVAPSLPCWDVLRVVGGEIQEVWAYAETEEVLPGVPVLLAGRFEQGGMFRVTLLPNQRSSSWRLTMVGQAGQAELFFPTGLDGPGCLSVDARRPGADDSRRPVADASGSDGGAGADASGSDEAVADASGSDEAIEEYWEPWDPWPALAAVFDERITRKESRKGTTAPGLSWEDSIRALELDDAVRRSVYRRRSTLLEHPEASEEVGFKGTMALVGCGLLWCVLVLLILSAWVPRAGYLVVPLLLVFLLLQLLRYLVPRSTSPSPEEPAR
jgi:hypothetical protein